MIEDDFLFRPKSVNDWSDYFKTLPHITCFDNLESVDWCDSSGLRRSWTAVREDTDNRIFISNSCDCYPNFGMIWIRLDELKNIYENKDLKGYTNGFITIEQKDLVQGKGLVLHSSEQTEDVMGYRNRADISIVFLEKLYNKYIKKK